MQRLGGGGYTRKRRGGGNDPSCGCDMRVGWPADLKAQGGGGCGCGGTCPLMNGGGMPVPDACPFAGTGMCGFYAKGGGCGCTAWLKKGGARYKPTKKNLNALRKWRQGKSIGFTMKASLKAKGLIPRTSRKYRGKKIRSNKYK